jgi:hypothetical protein
MTMRTLLTAITFGVAVILASTGTANAAAICKMADGSAGLTCVVPSSGQIYGCVKDLKDCAALSTTSPSGTTVAKPANAAAAPASAAQPADKKTATKSSSNIQNN